MSSPIYKCPNHLGCTIGYHGDDVNVPDGQPLLCPECQTPLKQMPRPRSKLTPYIVNLAAIAVLALAVWLAWPGVVKLWKRLSVPAQQK